MITIGAVSPCSLTGTEAGITKPFRLSLRFLSVWYSVLCTDILYRFDWDTAPFYFFSAVPGTTAGALSARPLYGSIGQRPGNPGIVKKSKEYFDIMLICPCDELDTNWSLERSSRAIHYNLE
jgi:hypothetical protein